MATQFRIGTFNVENLFSRAKVINFQNDERGTELLKKIAALDDLLDQEVYDKAQIADVYDELKDYISIEADKGTFFGKTVNGKRTVIAKGRGDWRGRIEFKRDTFSDQTRKNTARVIHEIKADICCLVEVESRPVLKNFCTDVVNTGNFKHYTHVMCIDGNDMRGIDVSLVSRFPIRNLRSHVDDKQGKTVIFSRDCLEVELLLPEERTLWLLINHLKSKLGPEADSAKKRKLQAQCVAEILKGYDLTKDLVAVAGDFNDTPDSDALSPLLQTPHLHDVLKEQFPNPADRWTYHFKTNEQIDYLLVSEPLRGALQAASVERRGMWQVDKFSNGAIQPFPEITRFAESASDHAAVYADFKLG
jgi:endonuclease/exonuclease/phosphatase family metal-dependent hydrolase